MATEDLLIRISERGANQTASQFEKVGKAGKAAGALIAAGAAVAGYGLKKSMDFESVMSEVRAVTGAGAADMKVMSDAALDLGAKSGLGAVAAAEAMAELGKAGLDAKTVIGTLPATITLAQAGAMRLADAASATADTMGLFGLKARDAGHIADVFATAANKTTADVSDFTTAIKQGGSAASAAGLSFDETTAALMALAKGGIKGSDAGTSLKSMLTQLATKTPKAAAAMKQLGIDVWDAHGNLKPLNEVANEFREGMSGLTREQRLNAATTIAGTDGQRALLALYREGNDGIVGYMKALGEQGSAAKVAAEKNNNLRGALARLKATFDSFLIRSITPYLDEVGAAINDFLLSLEDGEGKWGGFIRGVQRVGRFAGKLAATFAESVKPVLDDVWTVVVALVSQFQRGVGVGGLFRDGLTAAAAAALIVAGSVDNVWSALGTLIGWINSAMPVIAGLAVTFGVLNAAAIWNSITLGAAIIAMTGYSLATMAATAASSALAVVMAIILSPLGLFAIAVGVVVAAVLLLWKHSEGFRNWVKGAWEDISSWIGTAAGNIGKFFAGIPDTLKGVFVGIVNFMIGGLNNVIGVINTAIRAFNALPAGHDFAEVARIGLMDDGQGGGVTNNSGTDASRTPALAEGGTVRGVGSWVTGEAGAELNTKRSDGTVHVQPLTNGSGGGMGGMTAVVVAKDSGLQSILEMLIDRIEFQGARAT